MKAIATNLFKKNNKKLKETKIIPNENDILELSDERVKYLSKLGYVIVEQKKENLKKRKGKK